MAEKRMFSKKIIDTDWFMDMPQSSQNLYFHLSMRADDDGFVANPQRIIKMVGSTNDDYKLLIIKKFVIPFESGICVIKDWKINNYLRSDRYTETTYKQEKELLTIKENGEYDVGIPSGIPSIISISNSLSNSSIIKKEEKSIIPTLEEVKAYCLERKNNVDPEKWWNFYNSKNWYIGKNKMKNWKSAVITWEKSQKQDEKENKFAGMTFGTIL